MSGPSQHARTLSPKFCTALRRLPGRAKARHAHQNKVTFLQSLLEEAKHAFRKASSVAEVTLEVKKNSIVST